MPAMEYLSVLFLHVLFSIIWAGGGITAGFFIIPSVIDAGPAGGAVMQGVVRRKLPMLMTVAGTIVLLTGVRLYMIRFTWEWLGSANGIVLTLGAALGLGAYGIGVFVQRPAAVRLGALAAELARAGGTPSPAQAAELQAMRQRLGKAARLTAWHLLAAATLMAAHRLAAAM
jgi:hypothetical protein